MRDRLLDLRERAVAAVGVVEHLDDLKEVKVTYLGKKGELTSILREMGSLSPEERPVIGRLANEVRSYLEKTITKKEKQLHDLALEARLQNEKIDVTLPGVAKPSGTIHPLSAIVEQVEDIFIGMGYEVAEGPEIELDLYNFEMLNISKDHPARDMQDSLYITSEILLRTHTSPVQVRTLQKKEGRVPVRIICPGKVYRRDDDDATHSHQFMQIEGLVVDTGVSMGELTGTLLSFIEKIFGEGTEMRLRPSYFPFTEPSVEVDIFDNEKGWVEILGAGMVHPNVLEKAGYNPDRYSGFAFGMGVERIALLKYGIEDVRQFYNNDLRFLTQFQSV